MPSYRLSVNGREHTLANLAPSTPLLWVLREQLGLVGTKYSCGRGLCGACTVWLDDRPIKSCMTTVAAATGHAVTTIEGLASSPDQLHPVQQAWVDHDVPQCGFCQPGQIMTAAALLRQTPHPSDEEIADAMSEVLCRCYTYNRIRAALTALARKPAGDPSDVANTLA